MFLYRDRENKEQGPYQFKRIRALLSSGVISVNTDVLRTDGDVWIPLSAYIKSYREPVTGGNPCPDCGTSIIFGTSVCPHCERMFLPESRTPWGYFLMSLKLYTSFKGRATRAEYWSFWLISLVFFSIPFNLGFRIGVNELSGIILLFIGCLIGAALAVPNLAIIWRRFHDIGLSGLLSLIHFIPYIGSFAVLILMLLDSKRGANIYGPPTKYP